MEKLFKTAVSSNRYHTIQCSSLEDAEYAFTITEDIFDDFHKRGKFELSLYHFGKQEDLSLNGWTFAAVNQCEWIDAYRVKRTIVNIKCIDPDGQSHLIEVLQSTQFYWQSAPALYMNAVMVACLCANKKEAEQVIKLFDTFDFPEIAKYGWNNELYRIECLKAFASAIKKNEQNEDIPQHYIRFAKDKFNSMFKYFKEHVTVEKILYWLAPNLAEFED